MAKVSNEIKKTNVSCQICGKIAVSSVNKPHSLHKTKRVVKPNLQKFQGQLVCAKCIRKIKNK